MKICLLILTLAILPTKTATSSYNVLPYDMDKQKFTKQIKKHEGVKTKVYTDNPGHRTIGIGFNLERDDAEQRLRKVGANYQDVLHGRYELSNSQMQMLVEMEVDELEVSARRIVGNYDELDDVRQRVVVDMIFNLGAYGFSRFKSTIKHIEHGEFIEASKNMGHSLWARQVKDRAIVLASMMKYGVDTYDL
jgi:GH24 family phage-related lysozyme (muramidase)